MTRKEYLAELENVPVNGGIVRRVKAVYGQTLPKVIGKMLSFSEESVFFDDECRTLSLAEVVEAQADLDVDFKAQGLIPVIDCGDNDFIVFHVNDGSWSKYNIADELAFKKRALLEDLLV